MPTRELGMSLEGANGAHVGTTFELFKRHKNLPHPRESTTSEFYSYIPARDLAIDTEFSSRPSSDTSSPHTLKHTSRRIGLPGLPPTPPTHSRQSSGNQQSISSGPKYDTKGLVGATSVPGTPPNQKSPPTPDVTPPRNMPPLAFRPRPSDRYPSSRTDSFKTARENPYSSDEDEVSTVRPTLPSARPSENEVPQIPSRNMRRREIGLGLGLESDEGTATPRPIDDSQKEFVVFDGEWGSAGEVSEVEREWDDNLMRNVIVRKRSALETPSHSYEFSEGRPIEVLEDDIISPTNATKVIRGLPLQDRIIRRRLERDAGKFGDRAPWPLTTVDPESPTPDVRRFSAMSGRSVSSTVIEAMVVDAPPLRRKTLRHSKKQTGLRDFGSDRSSKSSAPNSVISSEIQHRLVHKTSKIPDKRHRSLASNTTSTTTSTSNRSRRREILNNGGIPVVVIPDRRSSTKSSKAPSLRSTSSRHTKRSMSLNSAPLSQSSKFNDPGYFDNHPHHTRTLSESAGSVRTIDFPPNIPARRSSLSAPTSRNTSRAGSLTAESLKAHNIIQQNHQDALRPEPIRSHPSADSHLEYGNHTRLNVDHNGDPFFGNRLSTQVTPFSQTSYETAGTTAEVSEAMAISFFPHQNTSVLVVEQPATSSQVSPPTSKGSQSSQPKSSSHGQDEMLPVTPPQPIYSMDELDSPLRNPRAPPSPPAPPAIKFIPPTPAVFTPTQEEDRQLGNIDAQLSPTDSKPKRGLSLMRRAFSNRRRNSEPIFLPGEGLLKRTFSLGGRRNETTQTARGTANPSTLYPSVADRPADGSRLHPFWRPSHFWDDLEDQDDLRYDDYDGYPIVDNRPAPPKRSLSGKLKRTFAIVPIKDDDYDHWQVDRRAMRRSSSGNLRITKQRSQSSLRRSEASGQRRYADTGPREGQFGYGFKEGNGGRFHTIPGLGVRFEYVGWGGVKRKLSNRRRQQRSEKLRASISSPREVQSGVDDVLRRRKEG